MLVKMGNRLGDIFGQAQSPGDIRTTRTAGRHDIRHDLAAIFGDIAERPFTHIGFRVGTDGHGNIFAQIFRSWTDQFETLFQLAVVANEHLADPGGVAAATEILQQNGIINVAQGVALQAHRHGYLRSNPAGPDTVAGGLAFGQVQRIGKSAEDFRQSQLFGTISLV